MNAKRTIGWMLTGAAWLAASVLPAAAQGRGGGRGGMGGGRGGAPAAVPGGAGMEGLAGLMAAAQGPGLLGEPPGGTLGGVQVTYDPDTNSLLIITDEGTIPQIVSLVQALDRPIPQALIKVLFLEVTHTNDFDFGVELKAPINNGAVNNGSVSTGFNLPTTEGAIAEVLYQDLNATLRALAQTTKLNVLSRPSVLARNNTQAVITVGQEVPRITNSRITEQGQTINTVTYDSIGIILRVTPFISPNNMVQLDVEPEISTFTGDSVAISNNATAPVYAVRSAQTSVVVPSGATIVIGGLMEDQMTENIQKVPVLGDVPILGHLFKRTVRSKNKTELLIFLTPNVVQRLDELQGLTDHMRSQTRAIPLDISDDLLERYDLNNRQPTPDESLQRTPDDIE